MATRPTPAEARDAAAALAARLRPFDLPPLAVRDLDGFLALRETADCPPMRALADACTETLDFCRAPPDPAELARRRRATEAARARRRLAVSPPRRHQGLGKRKKESGIPAGGA